MKITGYINPKTGEFETTSLTKIKNCSDKLTTDNIILLEIFLSNYDYTLICIGGGSGSSEYWIDEIYKTNFMSIPYESRQWNAEITMNDKLKKCFSVSDALKYICKNLNIKV